VIPRFRIKFVLLIHSHGRPHPYLESRPYKDNRHATLTILHRSKKITSEFDVYGDI
jgi:hypothetical protein